MLFQSKLRRGLKKNAKPEADAVRHELVSAVVWDILVGPLDDAAVIERLRALTPADIDNAFGTAVERVRKLHRKPDDPMPLAFAERDGSPVGREGTIAHAVGMLILTHHRLPESKTHLRLLAAAHVKADAALTAEDLKIATGTPVLARRALACALASRHRKTCGPTWARRASTSRCAHP